MNNRNSAGKGFENVLERIAAQAGILCIRIPDGCKVVGLRKLIRTKSPFDYIFCKDGKVCLVDAKTTIGKRFSITDEKLIKPHQLSILMDASTRGISAGFLFLFRLTETLCFLEAHHIFRYKNEGMKSVGPENCYIMGRLGEELKWNVLFK